MRELIVRIKMGKGAVDRGQIARLLEELAVWAGELPDEDCHLAMRDESGEVVGYAQVQTLEGVVDYRLGPE